MGVVTVSATFGCGGADIAPAVAARLGLPFHDRVIPAQVALRMGVPVEEAEANDESVVRGLWRVVASLGTMPDPVGGVLPGAGAVDERSFRLHTEHVLTELAQVGGVVLGRAAAIVLGDRPDALHVRLDGPPQRRLAAAVAHLGRPEDDVRREMQATDRARAAYVRHYHRCDPAEARLYHLVVDSTAFDHDLVVDLVVAAARARGISGGTAAGA
ncbi:cytidylate kinase-like family protein [Klenkia sp. LSe6-5]|uniref:Cytidylate kinase-like family protein n=1 Tax=Klenkia sesuvii TaxID=3103137 RepID=A0ABU8DVA7_9ACTN